MLIGTPERLGRLFMGREPSVVGNGVNVGHGSPGEGSHPVFVGEGEGRGLKIAVGLVLGGRGDGDLDSRWGLVGVRCNLGCCVTVHVGAEFVYMYTYSSSTIVDARFRNHLAQDIK